MLEEEQGEMGKGGSKERVAKELQHTANLTIWTSPAHISSFPLLHSL